MYLTNKFILYFIFCIFFSLGLSGYSHAQQLSGDRLEDLFTINNIEVNETARNATIARSIAISKAESIAFDKLKTKLVSSSDLHLLNNTDFFDITSLVLGIQVSDERAFSNRYTAKIDVTFSPEAIINIFTDAGAAFILNAGAELCIAHAHSEGLITRLWESDNKANFAWKKIDLINRLRNYKIPRATLSVRKALDTKSAEIGGFDHAATLGKGCGSGAGLIVYTKLITDETIGRSGLHYQYFISDILLSDTGSLFTMGEETIDELMVRLIAIIIDKSDESWRQAAMVKGDETGEIYVLLHTDTVNALARAQQNLQSLSVISQINVLRIAIPLSKIKISYTGNQQQLEKAFQQVGYNLEDWGQEYLLVRQK